MRRPHHSITRDHLSLAQRNGALSQVGKIKPFSLLSLSLSMVYPHAALFLIVVSCSHCARDEALRRPCHNIALHHLSLALEKWRPPPKERKNHFDCCFFSLSLVYPHAALFWIVVFSHHARAEAVRRRPRHSMALHHLSLALEKWRPLPNVRKIYVGCLFLLVFPWLRQGAEKGAAPHRVV